MSIVVRNVSKKFGADTALEGIDLEIPGGSLMALFGPSGSGKTTLLRIIAGLEAADKGNVTLEGEDSADMPVRQRQIGFVFQHYALFRHMTVFDNIGFALKMRKRPKAEIRDRVERTFEADPTRSIENRYPSQLSGGQRQRVALARAWQPGPRSFFSMSHSAPSTPASAKSCALAPRLHDEIHVTSVFVTHDQEEALELADQVVVMSRGRIEQVGTPDEVYHQPANPFVMTFLGQVNLFHGRWDESQDISAKPIAGNAPVVAYVRPHQLDITRQSLGDGTTWPGTIVRIHGTACKCASTSKCFPTKGPPKSCFRANDSLN